MQSRIGELSDAGRTGAGTCTRLYNIGAIFNRRNGSRLRQWVCWWLRPPAFGGFDVISTILLVCAVAASLGVGVLLAYGICLSMFRLFRIHATQVAARRVQTVAASGLVIGN